MRFAYNPIINNLDLIGITGPSGGGTPGDIPVFDAGGNLVDSGFSFPIPVAGGGTGDTSFTAYAVITGGTTSTGNLQNVSGLGSSGQTLTSNGPATLPTWQTHSAGDVTGPASSVSGDIVTFNGVTGKLIQDSGVAFPIPVGSGGTGQITLTAHDVLVGNGTSAVALVAPSATSGVPLISQGAAADPLFGTAVVAGGGTGAITLTGVLIGAGTAAITGNAITQHDVLVGGASNAITSVAPSAASGIPFISQGAAADPLFGTAVVAGGGTGAVTLTAHGVLIGEGTSAIAATAAGSTGQLLQSKGASADPAYTTATYPATATGTGTILRADGTNWVASTTTYPNTSTQGGIIVASGANVYANVTVPSGVSTIGTWPTNDGTDTRWYDPRQDIWFQDDFLVNGNSASPFGVAWQRISANSGSTNGSTATAGHPGVIQCETGTNIDGRGGIGSFNASVLFGGGRILLNMIVKLNALSTAVDTYTARIGFNDSATGIDGQDGLYFRYTHGTNSGNWVIVARNNNTESTGNTSTAADTNFNVFTIDVNAAATSVGFYINGSQVANSPLSTNIPTAAGRETGIGLAIDKDGGSTGTTNMLMLIDYISFWQRLTSSR